MAAISPALVVGLLAYPLFSLVETSFYNVRLVAGGVSKEFVGLYNYIRVFSDPLFIYSIEITLVFTIVSVIIEILLGIILALAVANSKFKRLWISILMISMIIPPLSVALIWRFMAYPEMGLLDQLTSFIGIGKIPWLSDSFWARILIIIVDVWHWTAFCFLIIYAGYVSLPLILYEAAMVDGASRLQTFKEITLPLLKPTILVAAFFRTIDILQAFPEIWQLTFGGPQSATTILNILAYLATFEFMDWGYASIVALTLMLITALFVLMFNLLLRRRAE